MSPSQTSSAGGRSSASRTRWVVGVACALAVAGSAYLTLSDDSDAAGARDEKASPAKAVSVVRSRRGELVLIAEYRGELVANAAEVAAQGTGVLTTVRGNLGGKFSKGDVVAVVDASEGQRLLAEALAQVEAMRANEQRVVAEWEAAKVEEERGRRLLEGQLASEQEAASLASQTRIKQAELANVRAQRAAASARVNLFKTQLSQAQILAPFDGAIAERYLDPGATVQPGTKILRLVETGPLRVRFRVSERDIGRVFVGTSFQVRTQATGKRAFPGVVEHIAAEVSRSDRTLAVEGVLDGGAAELRPGMYATVVLQQEQLTAQTLVPTDALSTRHLDDGTQSYGLYLVDEQGRARFQAVELIGASEGQAAVSGIGPEVVVVSFGHENLQDGNRVNIIEATAP